MECTMGSALLGALWPAMSPHDIEYLNTAPAPTPQQPENPSIFAFCPRRHRTPKLKHMAAEQPRKGHRKSRHGCICCKRRKVKCDEAKPSCTNCAHFNIPCQYVSVGEGGRAVGAQVPPQLPVSSARGRGRPRRDWAASLWPADYVDTKRSPREPTPVPAPLGETPPNLAHVELLHHFVVHTGPSLAGTDRQDDLIALFWSRNAPRIGLSTHAVLYLTFALAAYHLVYLGTEDVESQERYLSLAQYYSG